MNVYVLMTDADGTMRSSDYPIGFAVTTKEEADRYILEGGMGYTHSYITVKVIEDKDEAFD